MLPQEIIQTYERLNSFKILVSMLGKTTFARQLAVKEILKTKLEKCLTIGIFHGR